MLRVARTQSLRFSKQFSHSVSMTRWPGGRGGVGQYINNNPLLLRYMIMGSLLGSGGETRQWSGGARLCRHNIPTQNGDEFMLCSSIGWGEERGEEGIQRPFRWSGATADWPPDWLRTLGDTEPGPVSITISGQDSRAGKTRSRPPRATCLFVRHFRFLYRGMSRDGGQPRENVMLA